MFSGVCLVQAEKLRLYDDIYGSLLGEQTNAVNPFEPATDKVEILS